MKPLLAIAGLTLKAAIRFRLVWVLGLLIALTVLGLPLVIKDDGTARGLTQIVLTYTLGSITVLLGFATLWLGCGTLARDIEDCQMQLLSVKPVARWQIWLGKWLGILALNTALLALSGAAIYGLILWRANRLPTQPIDQRAVLFNEVLVARGSVRENTPDLSAEAERLRAALPQNAISPELRPEQLHQQLLTEARARHELVPVGFLRRWTVDLSGQREILRQRPIHLRVKFFVAEPNPSHTYATTWTVGALDKPRHQLQVPRLADETFHELVVPAGDWLDAQGQLIIDCSNRSETSMVFPLGEGLEVLFPQSGFAPNLVRGLLIILCWLGLLGALGLATASGLSFPVAAFCSLSVLLVVLSSSTLSVVVEQGSLSGPDHETGLVTTGWLDTVLLPVFAGLLKVISLVQNFAPIDSLSTGRNIGWNQVGLAWAQVILLLGGLISAMGILVFQRRELATAQSKS